MAGKGGVNLVRESPTGSSLLGLQDTCYIENYEEEKNKRACN